MERQNSKHRELHREMTSSKLRFEETVKSDNHNVCPKCGANVSSDAKFCEECGNPLGVCPHCLNPVDSNLSLCPHCGKPIHSEYCSFCNAPMDADDNFCEECGNPRAGIVCPECRTVNYRSFCRKCNTPLNEMAHHMVKRVMEDQRVVKARNIADKLNGIEQLINSLVKDIDTENGNGADTGSPSVGLTDADKALINKYNELFKVIGSSKIPDSQPVQPQQPQTKPQTVQEKRKKLKAAVEEFRSNMEDIQAILDSLLPDPQDPPEIQRNFLCACKVAINEQKSMITQKTYWVCNYCGCKHCQPADCAQPQLGGNWLVEETETIVRVTNTHTIYL